MAADGQRLMIYDQSCTSGYGPFGLTHSWIAGGVLYRSLNRLDDCRGVDNWDQALRWLVRKGKERPISEVQVWSHGKWGEVLLDGDVFDETVFFQDHPLYDGVVALKRVLAPDALLWFRTCETFGATRGHSFAEAVTTFFDCRAAGHTFIIGPWQSGLHSLSPGEVPQWNPAEGLIEGTPDTPVRAEWSTRTAPNTIHCLQGAIPTGM